MPNKLSSPRGSLRLHAADTNSPIVGFWQWEKAHPNTTWSRLERIFDSTHAIAPSVRAHKGELKASGKLTDAGVLEQLLASAGKHIRPLAKARRELECARAEIEVKQSSLKLKKPDPATASERQEIRHWLRSLSQTERDHIFRDPEKVDPLIAEAVLFAPVRAMTGIANSQFELLESRAVEAQHPGEMEEILELEEAFKIAERSVEANAQGLLQEIGHESRRKLDELAAPIDLEVAAEFEAEEAKRNQPPPRTAKDFADAATLPWSERSKLVDELLSAKVESWEK